MLDTLGMAAYDATSPMRSFAFTRREPGDHDVLIEIDHCGICHSDLHQVRGDWGGTRYPIVPGHEIVGHVARVGAKVTKFRIGDVAGVGCFVDSCRSCGECARGEEQYCENRTTFTYNSFERDGTTPTYGGYSTRIVVDEAYALTIAAGQPLERVAPLLCAGITTFSPLRRWNVGKGSKVGVLVLGGLGHMAVKIAAAMGAEVTLLSHSPSKREDARRLGAHDFVVHAEDAQLEKVRGRFDVVLDTVSASHELGRFVDLLATDGTLVLLGVPSDIGKIAPFSLIGRRRAVAGSLIGGIRETQEMLDFCAQHGVLADVESIAAQKVDEAYERMLKNDVRYRFVIDASSMRR
jgi:uncharacterized zinc-type alcohol dehydrogenase-like protein